MSIESETPSNGAQDQPENVSVFDFLYHDPRRVGSFLAQLDPDGHRTAFKRNQAVTDVSGDQSQAAIGGNALAVTGKYTHHRVSSSSATEAFETSFDPLWSNARLLLDLLEERDLIERDIAQAQIGQFVLASGTFSVRDYTMLKGMWKLPTVQAFAKAGADSPEPAANRQQRRGGKPQSKPLNTIDLALELMEVLPHSVHGRLSSGSRQVWTALREDCLITSGADLLLKHGMSMPGRWSMLGILDARPDHMDAYDSEDDEAPVEALLGEILSNLSPITRGMLGRPESAYAVTPLMVFRQVTGRPRPEPG